MRIPIGRFRLGKVCGDAGSVRRLRLIMTAIAGSMVIAATGCSSAQGTDLAPREEILKTLRAQGYLFNKHVISTSYGDSQNQVIVSGQIAQRTPDDRHVTHGFKITQYRNIVMENVEGGWKVKSAPPLEREQLSSRQRW